MGLDFSHALPVDLFRCHARSPKGHSESAPSVPLSAAPWLRFAVKVPPSSAPEQLSQAQTPPSVAGGPGWPRRSRNHLPPEESPKPTRMGATLLASPLQGWLGDGSFISTSHCTAARTRAFHLVPS